MALNGYILNIDGKEIHVVECPGCLFNGVQICLSSKKKADIEKLKHCAVHFRQFYEQQARKIQSSQLIIQPSAPIKLNPN